MRLPHAPLLVVLAALLGAALGPPPPVQAREVDTRPAVVRPRLVLEGRAVGSGTVFFLEAEDPAGAVAVGAAHSFDRSQLRTAGRVEFRLARTERLVATSRALHAPPGRPFADGVPLRADYLVFALEAPPEGARVLQAARDREPGALEDARVRILGPPNAIAQDEDDIFGSVQEVKDSRIEVRLDVPTDLRGWGGAPVLHDGTGRVVGLLQAAWPEGGTLRVGVAPIGGVLEALDAPYPEAGGRALASLEPMEEETAEAAGAAKEAPETDVAPAAPEEATPAEAESGGAAAPPAVADTPEEGETLLGRAGALETEVKLEIEHPEEDAVVGGDTGAYVAGRAIAHEGELRRFDVVFVLDTSGSTRNMTGADVNGNGIVGENRLSGVFGSTDPGDSILAAEVAAAKRLLRGLDPRNTRVGLVTFAGEPSDGGGGFFGGGRPQPALTEEALTSDFEEVEQELERVRDRGAEGLTHMAAGLDRAMVELMGFDGGLSEPDPESEKVVLFFTDGQPTLPHDRRFEADNVKAVLRAAGRLERVGIRVHSFAIGPEALDGPVAAVEMSARTGGYFTPVRQPGDLVDVVENVSFAQIETIEVRNATTGAEATNLLANADGSFGALVPLQTGKNRLEVRVRARDGSEAERTLTVQHAPDAPETPNLPRELVEKRNRLLEQRLVELKRERIAAEREQAEETRKELELEIERERERAKERAAEQRKELDLEAERLDSSGD